MSYGDRKTVQASEKMLDAAFASVRGPKRRLPRTLAEALAHLQSVGFVRTRMWMCCQAAFRSMGHG